MILTIVQALDEKVDDLTDGQAAIVAQLATHEERSKGQGKRIERVEKAAGGVGLALMVALISVVLSGCGLLSSLTAPPAPATPSAPKVDVVARAVNNTVALQDLAGNRFCTGVAAEGTIITAWHCVDDGEAFEVLYKGQAFPGVITLKVTDRDLAFVDAVGARLKATVPLADKAPVLGAKVIWTGYPLGAHFIMGTGIVGNPSIEITGLRGDYLAVYGQFIPGNSGGPVFNSKGALIGIVSRTMTYEGGFLPVGYAIPLHTLQDHLH
jgi:S1-C subfamily serine protease